MKVINHNLLWIYEIIHAYSKRKINSRLHVCVRKELELSST